MTILVNGEERNLGEGLAVADLIGALGLKPERLAVELNRKIIRRADWPATKLSEGDRVEIVHFVGGGCEGVDHIRKAAKKKCLTH